MSPATNPSGPLAPATHALLRGLLRLAGETRRVGAGAEPLYVRGAEIFVDGNDGLAPRIVAWRGARGAEGQLELRRLASTLAGRLLGSVDSEAVAGLPDGAVGPLPTTALLMAAAARGDDDDRLAFLGGLDARYRIAADRRLLLQLPGIDPEAVYLLSRFDGGLRVGEALRQAPADRRSALEILCRLRAVGLVEPADGNGAGNAADDEAEVLERFRQRIAKELAVAPLDVAPEAHRARLADLLSTHGGMDHYELLQIDVTAAPEQIHRAYDDLARWIHPCHAAPLGLASKAALELLFERATTAYRVLTDPLRRVAYHRQVGIDVGERPPSSDRADEQRRLAREHYEQAVRYVGAEQYHFAVELLRQSLRFEARAESLALLGSCQARNPNWLPQAAASYARALQLDPRNAGLCVALGQVHERLEDVDEARRRYGQALELMPGHPEAELALERLGRANSSAMKTKPAKKR